MLTNEQCAELTKWLSDRIEVAPVSEKAILEQIRDMVGDWTRSNWLEMFPSVAKKAPTLEELRNRREPAPEEPKE